jgi:hypothetical protein
MVRGRSVFCFVLFVLFVAFFFRKNKTKTQKGTKGVQLGMCRPVLFSSFCSAHTPQPLTMWGLAVLCLF